MQNLLILLSAGLPLSVMASQAWPSPLFYAMLVLALIVLARARGAGELVLATRELAVFLAAPLLVVVFVSIYHGKFFGLDFETNIRFLLAGLVLLPAYGLVQRDALQKSLAGFVLAALFAALYVFYLTSLGQERPETSGVYNPVAYGSLMALLMAFCVYLLPLRLSPWPRAERLAKLLVAALALVGVLLTLTRTAWLAMPVFLLIAGVLFLPRAQRKYLGALLLLGVLAMAAILGTNSTMRARVALAYQEASECTGAMSTSDNSICIRFQLWRASLDMLDKRPLAGNGSKRYFNQYLNSEALPEGVVSPFVAEGWGEPHNDLLLYLASYGYPGGIALLLAYLGPAWIFARRLFAALPNEQRVAAAMGLALCLGMLIFGFTEAMLRGMRTVSFYAAAVALFAALSAHRQPPQHRKP